MPLFKYSCVTLMVLSISACATLATKPNEVEVAAQKLVGQPASNAFKIFGKPDHGLGPSSYGSGGFYGWNRVQTHVTPEKVFVQTGVEYIGQKTTMVGIGGGGVIGQMPVGSEPVYRKTGYTEICRCFSSSGSTKRNIHHKINIYERGNCICRKKFKL